MRTPGLSCSTHLHVGFCIGVGAWELWAGLGLHPGRWLCGNPGTSPEFTRHPQISPGCCERPGTGVPRVLRGNNSPLGSASLASCRNLGLSGGWRATTWGAPVAALPSRWLFSAAKPNQPQRALALCCSRAEPRGPARVPLPAHPVVPPCCRAACECMTRGVSAEIK